MKIILTLAALAASLCAQDAQFRVTFSRWSNHDFPALIAPSIEPFLPPAQAKSDGILAVVTVLNSQPVEAVELTMTYRTPDGKRWRQVRTVQLGNTGCTPEPCLWAPVLFDVGVVDFDSVRIEIGRAHV